MSLKSKPDLALKTTPDQRSIGSLKGAGAQTLSKLERIGLRTVEDLMFHLPVRYEDRTRVVPIGELRDGDTALIEGQILLAEVLPSGRRSLVVRLSDGTGTVHLRFFHYSQAQIRQFNQGRRLCCFGEIRLGFYGLELSHPDYRLPDRDEPCRPEQTLTPVYPLTEGIHQKALRNLISQAMSFAGEIQDWLPAIPEFLQPYVSLADALRFLHGPPADGYDPSSQLATARNRLVFEELLAHHLSLSRYRMHMRVNRAPVLTISETLKRKFDASLPFALTGAQQRVVSEIVSDLGQARPMMRLVQGDVGSGKTVVAAFAALTALDSQHQVAIMAPTELLAEQHYRSFGQWLEPLGVKVLFLSGKAKGAHRLETLNHLESGAGGVIVGTHALFQEQVVFFRLGLVIIDEQHRFGVHQRLALRKKGSDLNLYPHQLIMTATPIPRTLAMIGYADLNLSVIDERPPGRSPVKTSVLPATRRDEIVARITDWVDHGRQVYWVCTLIEGSDTLQAEAAEESTERLVAALPHLRIGLIHGRLKAAGKAAVMADFKAGHIDVLVATTVIEVGVDVPNASLMIIENAERLGLAQLHQLRGRVGRGPGEAHCVLLYQTPLSNAARQRLAILRETDDGFLIAEKDMEIRGPGELLGTRQTGQVSFRIADLVRDAGLIDSLDSFAEYYGEHYPAYVDPVIKRWLGQASHYMEA